jgi:hypothetical protein
MLRARITIDLPSAEIQRKRLWRRRFEVRGFERVTAPPAALLKGVFGAFAAAGVTDALSLLVDGSQVYVDGRNTPGDLELALIAALDDGVDDQEFGEVLLAMQTRTADLRVVMELSVKREVPLGEPELVVEISARPDALRVRPGERADTFAARVGTYAAAGYLIEEQRLALDALVHSLARELAVHLVCNSVVAEQTRVEVLRPEPQQVRLFRHLPFGARVEPTEYNPVAAWKRTPDADPYAAHWRDPYWPLANYVLVGHIVRDGHWASQDVWIVDGEGFQLATGDDPSATLDGWTTEGAVSFGHGVSVAEDETVAEEWLALPDQVAARS